MVKQAEKKKRMHPLLPAIGFIVGLCLLAISYFAAPVVIDLMREQMGAAEFDQRLNLDPGQEIENSPIHFGFMAMIFFATFALMMTIVSIAIGEDPTVADTVLHPRDGDIKGLKQYAKHIEREEKKRAKLLAEKRKQEERDARRRG